MAEKQNINTPLIATTGIVSGFLLIVIVVGLQAWYYREEWSEEQSKLKQERQLPVQATKLEQMQDVQDGKGGRMPVEAAMKQIIETRGQLPATLPAGQSANTDTKPDRQTPAANTTSR